MVISIQQKAQLMPQSKQRLPSSGGQEIQKMVPGSFGHHYFKALHMETGMKDLC